MDFSTSEFWLSLAAALPLLLMGNFMLRGKERALLIFHKLLILVLSLTLLGLASTPSLLIFLYVTLTAYGVCRWGLRLGTRGRKVLLWLLIPLLLLPLLYYKYAYFLGTCIDAEWNTLKGIIIPIGISFYTFQIIGFCVDTLMRNEPMPGFVDYMNFGCFFPQIVAGPIERRSDLLPQMRSIRLQYNSEWLKAGIPYIILGLFFKLALADNLASAYKPNAAHTHAISIWVHNLVFTFRIYFDFAGYGLTAYGIAKCLGVTLRMNFLSPYTAANITEFWRRWHTSLTGWFRDYIYFPLGGSRTRRWALNTLFVFAVSGLWHGAGWNFILWGTLAGLALVIHKAFRRTGLHLPGIIGWCMTFGLMVFIWMFFYNTEPAVLKSLPERLLDADGYRWIHYVGDNYVPMSCLLMPTLFLPLSFLTVAAEYLSQKRTGEPYRLFLSPLGCGIMVFLIILLQPGVKNQFIYFAF